MIEPATEVIPRTGRHVELFRDNDGPADWKDVEALLRRGEGTSWLSVPRRRGGVHTRPVFAAWTGASFVFASRATAAKTSQLEANPDVSLAVDLGTLHVVTEGTAARLTSEPDLQRVSRAMREVYDWPTQIVGDELDAPYSAPTSGGPPFQGWEITPRTIIALPTGDQVEPTRFTFA